MGDDGVDFESRLGAAQSEVAGGAADVRDQGAGVIFLNYRRSDAAAWAGRLFDRLEERFGAERLFMDVDSIPAGRDVVEFLEEQVGQCDVCLAPIGPTWLSATNPETDRRRLDDPNDFVRIEIVSALGRGVRVIPVLLEDTPVPPAERLPEPLRPLTRRRVDTLGAGAARRL